MASLRTDRGTGWCLIGTGGKHFVLGQEFGLLRAADT